MKKEEEEVLITKLFQNVKKQHIKNTLSVTIGLKVCL